MHWTGVPRLLILMGTGRRRLSAPRKAAAKTASYLGRLSGGEPALPHTIWAESLRLSENGTNARYN